jgi:O-antigen ligase
VSKKKRKREPGGRAAAAVARPAPRDAGAAIAAVFLVLGIAAAGLAVDSGADNSFDSPKRLLALISIAAAALAAFGFSRWLNPLRAARKNPDAASAAALLISALVLAALSAFLSPRREPSLDAMRPILLYGLLLPLGASRVAEKRSGLLFAAFVAVVSVNAVVSVLQATNRYQPFPLATRGSREATGAFVGNPGYLAFALALAAVACLGILLFGRGAGSKTAAAVGGAISLAGLLVNRNLTSLSALLAGAAVLLAARLGKRALLPIGVLIVLAIAAALLYRPMRERAAETFAAVRSGDWDRVVTYRLGAWAAAVEMTREKPGLGFGPGTYGAEFATHRLRAEIATRRRMVNPLTTSSYAEAHSDYLQPFAEAGIPAGLALVAAAFFLLRGLLRAARRTESPARAEALCIFALLAAGAVAALTWFPFQRPISAIPLLLLAGRGWRISADGESERGTP